MDSAINRHVIVHARHTEPAVVAAFVTFDGEPNLLPAMETLEADGVTIALPVVRDSPGKSTMAFHLWTSGCEMRDNRYGITEPVGTGELHPTQIDLVLLPLVAWDANGGRLGMGASFYDRYFQPFAQREHPLRAGVAYQLQRVDHIPLDPWDIRLHGVFTETGFRRCEEH